MTYFSNMSIEEYIKLNSENISPEFLVMVENLLDNKEELEDTIAVLKRHLELEEEQVYFAKNFVEKVDEFVKTLPKSKQTAYNQIRCDSMFEI